jgi:hypothetical protein
MIHDQAEEWEGRGRGRGRGLTGVVADGVEVVDGRRGARGGEGRHVEARQRELHRHAQLAAETLRRGEPAHDPLLYTLFFNAYIPLTFYPTSISDKPPRRPCFKLLSYEYTSIETDD